jgi:hypothetical protein
MHAWLEVFVFVFIHILTDIGTTGVGGSSMQNESAATGMNWACAARMFSKVLSCMFSKKELLRTYTKQPNLVF